MLMPQDLGRPQKYFDSRDAISSQIGSNGGRHNEIQAARISTQGHMESTRAKSVMATRSYVEATKGGREGIDRDDGIAIGRDGLQRRVHPQNQKQTTLLCGCG